MHFCGVAQIGVCVAIIFKMVKDRIVAVPVGANLDFFRFVCCILFHISFINEIKTGLSCIKYIAMHKERFAYPWSAFIASNLQVMSILAIEMVNIWNLTLQPDIIELIMNYIALGCVAHFDDEFYNQFTNKDLKKILEGPYPIVNHRKTKLKIEKKDYDTLEKQLKEEKEKYQE